MAEIIEYKVLTLEAKNEQEIEDHCNNQGAGRWRLAALVPKDNTTFLAVFYRTK